MSGKHKGLIGMDPSMAGGYGGATEITIQDDSDSPGVIGMDADNHEQHAAPRIGNWPRALSWKDFREVSSRPTGNNEDAQIHTEIELSPKVSIKKIDGRLLLGSFSISLRIINDDTWVVTSAKSDSLLAHEKGHYDITGLMARDMATDLAAIRATSPGELQREVNRIQAHYGQHAQTLSDQYDEEKETNHGLNSGKQAEWENRIREAIRNGTRLAPRP